MRVAALLVLSAILVSGCAAGEPRKASDSWAAPRPLSGAGMDAEPYSAAAEPRHHLARYVLVATFLRTEGGGSSLGENCVVFPAEAEWISGTAALTTSNPTPNVELGLLAGDHESAAWAYRSATTDPTSLTLRFRNVATSGGEPYLFFARPHEPGAWIRERLTLVLDLEYQAPEGLRGNPNCGFA
ncbi:MAG: hypothetical protein HYT80_03420 [Euryarchaeota archaeon]|nr:hypothetical protein [Euryarchaeota archaeon]